MKEILDSIKEKLALIPELKYVDADWGQLDFFSPNFPVKWPCALVDISTANFSEIGINKTMDPINRQIGEFTLAVRVANLKLMNSSGRAPRAQKDDSLEIWDLIETVHKNLHSFEPAENCGALIRMNMSRLTREDGVQEYLIQYSGAVSDV